MVRMRRTSATRVTRGQLSTPSLAVDPRCCARFDRPPEFGSEKKVPARGSSPASTPAWVVERDVTAQDPPTSPTKSCLPRPISRAPWTSPLSICSRRTVTSSALRLACCSEPGPTPNLSAWWSTPTYPRRRRSVPRSNASRGSRSWAAASDPTPGTDSANWNWPRTQAIAVPVLIRSPDASARLDDVRSPVSTAGLILTKLSLASQLSNKPERTRKFRCFPRSNGRRIKKDSRSLHDHVLCRGRPLLDRGRCTCL